MLELRPEGRGPGKVCHGVIIEFTSLLGGACEDVPNNFACI